MASAPRSWPSRSGGSKPPRNASTSTSTSAITSPPTPPLDPPPNRLQPARDISHDTAGHASLQRHGATVTPALLEKVKAADGLMLGPMATYDFKDEAKGEINP